MDADDELMVSVRDGNDPAMGELFMRHRDVAWRVAARHGSPGEAEDVVAEVFARLLVQLRLGRGPTVSFRAYLLTAIRHEAARRSARAGRCVPVDDIEQLAKQADSSTAGDDYVLEAYASLPPRWRRALWQLDVEGRRPRELAGELGLSPNAVSALGCRARAALRAAYLDRREAA